MNCTCVVCTDMLLFYLSAGSSAKNQDMGHEGETGSSRCSSCFLKSVITSKAECPNLGLVKYSPGWKTQQLARLILTVDWSSETLLVARQGPVSTSAPRTLAKPCWRATIENVQTPSPLILVFTSVQRPQLHQRTGSPAELHTTFNKSMGALPLAAWKRGARGSLVSQCLGWFWSYILRPRRPNYLQWFDWWRASWATVHNSIAHWAPGQVLERELSTWLVRRHFPWWAPDELNLLISP